MPKLNLEQKVKLEESKSKLKGLGWTDDQINDVVAKHNTDLEKQANPEGQMSAEEFADKIDKAVDNKLASMSPVDKKFGIH